MLPNVDVSLFQWLNVIKTYLLSLFSDFQSQNVASGFHSPSKINNSADLGKFARIASLVL